MYGPSNCGKTFSALDMALHIALGWEWHGRKTWQGKVLYVAVEAGFGIKKRIKAFMKHHGLTYADIPDFHLLPKGVNFCSTKEDAEEIIKEISILGGVVLVVIDTLSRALAGGDENSPVDMGTFVMNCDLIRQDTKAAAAVVHHTGKNVDGGARGHSSLLGAIDTEISFTSAGDIVTAKITKQRDGEKDALYSSTLKVIEVGIDNEGEPITSCVLIPTDAPAAIKRPHTGQKKRAYEHLLNLIIDKGMTHVPKPGMPKVKVVRVADFRTVLKQGNIVNSNEPDNVRRRINTIITELNNSGFTATWEDYIWIPGQTGQNRTDRK